MGFPVRWERRLKDLGHLLNQCHHTYLEPDLFRMNSNQFLQTARTVTFIIQKHKSEISGFDAWYSQNVLAEWKNDEIMTWAKDARNTIEKEGDLELNSHLKVTLLFSYLAEEDVELIVAREDLLRSGVKRLARQARFRLPSGVADAAAIKIERRWVTTTLPEIELLQALGYVYARMYSCCNKLANHLGRDLDKSIPHTSDFDSLIGDTRQIRYIKLNGSGSHTLTTEKTPIAEKIDLPDSIKDAIKSISTSRETELDDINYHMNYYSKMAELTFTCYGNHKFMLFVLGEQFRPLAMYTTQFADQADKFIWWRAISEKITNLKPRAVVWIGETWLRSYDGRASVSIKNMPIIGERLFVHWIDNNGLQKEFSWEIIRNDGEAPRLEKIADTEPLSTDRNYAVVPVLRALGLPDPSYIRRNGQGL